MIGRRSDRNQRLAPTKIKPVSTETEAQATTPRVRRSSEVSAFAAWRQQHRSSARASLQRLTAKPFSLLLTVLALGVALALPLLLWVVVDNARNLSGGLRDAREITVFLKPDIDDRSAASYADQLRAHAAVDHVGVRSPAQGLEEFRQLSGFDTALDALDGNPLPSVLLVTPRVDSSSNNAARDASLVASLRSDQRVDLVQYDIEWRRRLGAILDFGEIALQSLATLLALAALLIVGNTIRVDIQSRSEEIEVMQLIGASNGFIRRPFLYAGAWYGLLGGITAVVIVTVVELAVAPALGQLLTSYEHRFDVHGLGFAIAGAVIIASAVLGWFGAASASVRALYGGAIIE